MPNPRTAWVFPGQGSQFVGMGKALAQAFPEARAVFDAADDALGMKLSTLCFEGPQDALTLTANTQPAILAVSLAVHAVFSRRAAQAPAFVAGHSLGEYSALVAAGSMGLFDAVRSVRARGTFMQEAVPKGVGAMAAVLGLPPEQVAEVCARSEGPGLCQVANYNEPGQTVIAGHAQAVERASQQLKAAGARRVLPLPVSAPFHCALMQPVVERLAEVLGRVAFRAPAVPVVTNVEATANVDAARIATLLLQQVTSSVRWTQSVQWLQTQGVTALVELGPGKVLSGLSKRISTQFTCLNIEDESSLDKALAAGL